MREWKCLVNKFDVDTWTTKERDIFVQLMPVSKLYKSMVKTSILMNARIKTSWKQLIYCLGQGAASLTVTAKSSWHHHFFSLTSSVIVIVISYSKWCGASSSSSLIHYKSSFWRTLLSFLNLLFVYEHLFMFEIKSSFKSQISQNTL